MFSSRIHLNDNYQKFTLNKKRTESLIGKKFDKNGSNIIIKKK
jgi:hypothetical protein